MPFDLVSMGIALLVILTVSVTISAVWLLWRNGYERGWRAARDIPPTCPNCGYNLTGLTACRCPECGKQFTLETLWRSAVILRRNKEQGAAPDQRSPEKSRTEQT